MSYVLSPGEKVFEIVQERDKKITALTKENAKLKDAVSNCIEVFEELNRHDKINDNCAMQLINPLKALLSHSTK